MRLVNVDNFSARHGVSENFVNKISHISGSPIRDIGVFTTHQCPQLSSRSPETDMSNCTINDDQFTTSIEHGDW